MKPQMNLLYLSSTGHVLSLFTRAAEGPQPEKMPDPFVGDGLHVRGLGDPPSAAPFVDYNNQDFVIPVDELAILPTDLDPGVLVAPRMSYVDSTKKLKSATVNIQNGSVASPAITITVPVATAAPLSVLVLVEGQSLGKPIPLSGTIPATSNVTTVNTPSLSPGSYYALIFVATYLPFVAPFSV